MQVFYGSKGYSRGSTLIIALVFLLILTIVGITAMRFSSMEETMAGNSQSRNYIFQQAVSEIYLNIFDFNNNVAARNKLGQAQNKNENETDSRLLEMLPATTKASIDLDAKLKDIEPDSKLRYLQEAPCDDGSSVDKFVCISYEMEVRSAIDNGASSHQAQGIVFQNNKAE